MYVKINNAPLSIWQILPGKSARPKNAKEDPKKSNIIEGIDW